jgi:predicted small secreted protein
VKRAGGLQCGLPLALAVLGASLVAGCNTYHYYDIDIKASSPVTETETSVMNFCQVTVAGAASDTLSLTGGDGCPPNGFPDIGTVEYATFADSGEITFTFTGYIQNLDPSGLCTTASTMLTASDEITQTATITADQWNATNCPPHVSSQ